MKLLQNKIIAVVLSIIVLLFMIIFVVKKDVIFSENENRYLQEFPKFSFSSLIKGTYIEKIEDYFADQFPFRDAFMSIKTNTDKILGKKDINGVYLGKDDYLIEKYNTPANSNKIIKILNQFNENNKNINMNLMLVPTSISVNYKKLPKNVEYKNQMNELNYIYESINFNTINVYDTLKKNNKIFQMYYRLDHHWTSYGAYYAYQDYCKANNIDFFEIDKFKIKEVTNSFNGTLYSKSNDYSRKSDSIYLFKHEDYKYDVEYVYNKKKTKSLYELSYLEKKDKYSLFLDNNHPLIIVTNKSIDNDEELVIIKDSYANSFVPFIVNHYKKVHIIDPRYYNKNISEYIKDNKKIKDVLILYNMNTIDEDIGILTIK